MGNTNFASLDDLEQALQNDSQNGGNKEIYFENGQLTTEKNPYEESLVATGPLKHGWAIR